MKQIIIRSTTDDVVKESCGKQNSVINYHQCEGTIVILVHKQNILWVLNFFQITSSEHCTAVSSTQLFHAIDSTIPITTSTHTHDQRASTIVLDSDNSDTNELNRLLNEYISFEMTMTQPKNNLYSQQIRDGQVRGF